MNEDALEFSFEEMQTDEDHREGLSCRWGYFGLVVVP